MQCREDIACDFIQVQPVHLTFVIMQCLNVIQTVNLWIFLWNLLFDGIFHQMQTAGLVRKCELPQFSSPQVLCMSFFFVCITQYYFL